MKAKAAQEKIAQEIQQTRQDVQSGKIPSIVVDSSATSNCGWVNDPFIYTCTQSAKVFQTPLGQVAKAFKQAKPIHHVQEPARMVDNVSGFQNNSLLSVSTFADANYITVFTLKELQIFDCD